MSIDERHRIALHEAARDSWGPEIAGTLMEMLPPGGWAEVATKSDLVLLKSDLVLLKSDLTVLSSELRVEMADLRATLERSLRSQLMWTVATLIAGFGAIAAVTALVR